MSKARSTGNIGNIVKASVTGVTISDGTNDLLSINSNGDLSVVGDINASTLDGIDGASFLQTGSFNTFSSSIDTTIKNKLNGDGVISGSVQVDITNTTGYSTFSSSLSSSIGSLSGSVATTTSGLAGRITTIEENYVTTGSNIFIGNQTITGSICTNGNIVTTGQIVAQTINVQQVTSSIVYSCGSNIFGTNINNTQQFTGSVSISGSIVATGTSLISGSSQVDVLSTTNIAQLATTGSNTFSATITTTGNGDTSAGLIVNNPTGNSGICQHYINFTAGATTIGRIFRGNGTSGATANGLNIDNFGGFQVRLNQLGGSGDSFNILGGNIGINTSTPSNLLHIEASNNTTNQFRVNSCDGLNAGLRSYTTSDGAGLILNHYYAVEGEPYLRTSDFVSNQGDGASTQMRFFTKGFNANPSLAMVITSGRCVGINTNNPQSVLDVQNCINSSYDPTNTLISNQWIRTSNPSTSACATSGILFVAQGPGGGNGISTINGVTTSCGSMSITFGTRHASGAITERMRILSYGLVGIGTATPFLHPAGDLGGLVVKGIGGDARGIIEVHSGTDSGKAVFQQVGGTTYIGNLDKGTSGGSLRLLVNGSGTSASEALIINCASRVLINNTAAVGTGADYSRVTISGTCTKTQLPGVGGSILHLTSCENDNPFGVKFNIIGNENSCLRYLQIQTGDHNITNQGNIVFQNAGGHVGVGTTSPRTKLQVTPDYNAEVPVLGCASGVATFTSTNTNYGLQLNSTSDGSFHIQSQRFDNIATAYDLILNWAGGNVLVGTQSSIGKLTVGGTVAIPATVGGNIYTIDTMNGYQSIANGGFVDFDGMSGMLLVNNWLNGGVTLYLMGGGNTGALGSVIAQVGTLHHSPNVGGYRWCNNYGSTANFGFQVFRTRNTA